MVLFFQSISTNRSQRLLCRGDQASVAARRLSKLFKRVLKLTRKR
jgi:hypothetical protein